MTLWALIGVAAAGPWVVDGTSLRVHYGNEPVEQSVECPAPDPASPVVRGRRLTTLGVGLVAYSKKQGTMTWGHASLRAVYCLERELHDVEYEAYRLSAWNETQLREEHAGEGFADDPWLTTQRGRKVLFRNVGAIDHGWFGEAQARNRSIYVVWLDLPPDELDLVVQKAEARWERQLEALRARETLPERFGWIGNNCTSLFEEVLPAQLTHGRPVTPFAWVRRLEPGARLLVLHPSHHLVRKWRGELPSTSRRMRPVFRRRAGLPRDLLPALRASLADARPVVPWASTAGAGIASEEGVPTSD